MRFARAFHFIWMLLSAGCALEGGEDALFFGQDADEATSEDEGPLGSVGACPSSATLEELVSCVVAAMPRSGSGGFVPPKATERADFYAVTSQMMSGACGFPLPLSLVSPLRLFTLHDAQSGKAYCVLMEVEDKDADGYVDRGWGTFIVDPSADRELAHHVPHPLADAGTEAQGIGMFKATSARSFLMCGSHRLANAEPSACDPDFEEADCAHGNDNMFFAAVQAVDAFYASRGEKSQQIQWHGMAASTCPGVDAYLSHGSSAAPPAGSSALALQASLALRQPTWNVDVTGSGTCSLDAASNVAGRYLNGVPATSACATPASATSGKFLHIEQAPGARVAAAWIPAALDAFPALPPLPPAPPLAVAEDAEVHLFWEPSLRARSYSVHVKTSAGGAYAPLVTGLVGESFTHLGALNGVTYFYRIIAVGLGGASAPSAEASATPSGIVPPTGLTGVAGKKKATLSWNAVPGATGYSIARATAAAGPYAIIGTTNGTTFTNSALSRNVTYHFTVAAIGKYSMSAPSAAVAVTPT